MAVYKNKKNNTWYFRIYVDDKSGIRKQKSKFGYKTKAACLHAQSEFLLNYNIQNDNITFDELYNNFIKYKKQNLKYQSFRTLKNRFENHILPYFKDYKINSIKVNDYINWKEEILKKNFSHTYNSSLHVCMVSILNFGYDFYDLKENIASKVGNFSNKNYYKSVDFWTLDEFKTFISNIDDLIYSSLFNVLYYTGMRIGECLALNWNDINNNYININKTLIRGNNNKYSFNTPKTHGSNRIIKLDKHTISILNNLKKFYKQTIGFNENWFVFGGVKPLSTTTIERKKNYYCKISNVKQIRIHDFRHSHATLLLSNRVPIPVISKRLGHSNISTTLNIYSHFVKEDEDKAVDFLNNLEN